MIVVPAIVWSKTLAHFRRCGAGRRECAIYWTGPADGAGTVDAAVHPVHTASAGSYELNDDWLHHFWVGLGRERRSVRVQVHTHAFEAFHSRTDDLWPIVHVPGFLSLVIPNFATKFERDGLFLAEVDGHGTWKQVHLDSRLKGIP